MTPTYDPNQHTTTTPDPHEVRPRSGWSTGRQLLLAALAVASLLLLTWLWLAYDEPVPADGPATGEIEQEEDDAIDSTDG